MNPPALPDVHATARPAAPSAGWRPPRLACLTASGRGVHLPLVLLAAVVASGCDGSVAYRSPTAPPEPTPSSPSAPPPTLPTSSDDAAAGTYLRVTPTSQGSLSFHGGILDQRLVLDARGRLALQYESGRYGFFEYLGGYARQGDLYLFTFDDNPGRWYANAAFRGPCVVVDYNLDMDLSDFEDGEYCR